MAGIEKSSSVNAYRIIYKMYDLGSGVRKPSGLLQGNLHLQTRLQSRSFGVAERDWIAASLFRSGVLEVNFCARPRFTEPATIASKAVESLCFKSNSHEKTHHEGGCFRGSACRSRTKIISLQYITHHLHVRIISALCFSEKFITSKPLVE